MTETAEAATRVTGWPGKSPDDRGIAHPALYHMLDVAAVAERLIAAEPFTAAMRDALVMLTALHDLGKISDSFRAMLTTGARQYARHWEMTEVLLYHHDGLLADLLGGTGRSEIGFTPRSRGITVGRPGLPTFRIGV